MSGKPTVYWEYLRLEELLSLQVGIEGDESALTDDEVLFIVVHQIDELWLKLAIRELVAVRDTLDSDPVPEASLAQGVRSVSRVALLFRMLAEHFAVMETMTTRDYLAFRDKLAPASGFQSAQMREVEILLGLADSDRIALGEGSDWRAALRNTGGTESPASRRVARRMAGGPSLADVVARWLSRTPIQGSSPSMPGDAEQVGRFLDAYCEAHARAQRAIETFPRNEAEQKRVDERIEGDIAGARRFLLAEDAPEDLRATVMRTRAALVFIESYRELPLLAWPRALLDAIVAMEQGFVVFRQRHARMVERMIGRRTGTGGSAGVDYLDQTALRYRVFPDLWAARTVLLERAAMPPLEHAEVYGFATDEP